MVLILHFTYQEELSNVERKASGEAYFIMMSLNKDLKSLDTIDRLDETSIKGIMENYLTYYKAQKVQLAFWNDNQKFCGNLPEEEAVTSLIEHTKKGTQRMVIQELAGKKYMLIACYLEKPYQNYKMVYGYALDTLTASRYRLLMITIGIDAVITLLLAGVLYGVLTHLTRPLKQLEEVTDEVAMGQYDKKIQVKGRDEFALLGEKFNLMSGKIEEQIEMLKEENEKKQLLIDNMAHEFRTPLTSISGYAEYMKMAPLNEDERLEALDYMMSEAKRLQKLSQVILKMADLRENELEMEDIEVEKLIKTIKQIFGRHKGYEKTKLCVECTLQYMRGNAVMLESLLVNLIENGMRATQESGQVEVRFDRKIGTNEAVQILVVDHGIGMAAEEVSKISQPFYRIDKARSRKMGGVGLGVSFCQAIVKAHGGTIAYESELGKGTKVSIVLPQDKGFTT